MEYLKYLHGAEEYLNDCMEFDYSRAVQEARHRIEALEAALLTITRTLDGYGVDYCRRVAREALLPGRGDGH